MKKYAVIGCGNLGTALVKGLLEAEVLKAEQVVVCRRKDELPSPLQGSGVALEKENLKAAEQADVVILAVLPQQAHLILQEIAPAMTRDKLLVSVVTGMSVNAIREVIGDQSGVVRAMPNTAIAIRESMTCICGDDRADLDEVTELFSAVGKVMTIREEQMSSATALCSCGIAFFLRAIRAASQGGIEIDFHAEESLEMAAQTAKGAAALLLANGSHPESEIDRVTSPNGCTISGLNQMEHSGFSSAFIKGISHSAEKAGKLYEDAPKLSAIRAS